MATGNHSDRCDVDDYGRRLAVDSHGDKIGNHIYIVRVIEDHDC